MNNRSPAEIFNDLSPIPGREINLGDGRVLRVTEWQPDGRLHGRDICEVAVRGYIVRTSQKVSPADEPDAQSTT